MELPSHRETDEGPHDTKTATTIRRSTVLVVAVLALLFAVIVILHLTGVLGPGAH